MDFLIRALSHLPLWLLHLKANFLAWLARDVLRYRREVVFSNLRNSFPDKSETEIRKIARKFYLHLADLIVESLKAISISPRSLQNRVVFRNSQIPESAQARFDRMIVLTLHLGNWEWTSLGGCLEYSFVFHPLYLRLSNRTMDRLMFETRSRWGAIPLPSFRALIRELKLAQDFRVAAILADQTPPAQAEKYWANFLNQETAFLPGIEKLPRHFNCPVLFMWSKRVKRGHYEVNWTSLAEPPYGPDGPSIMKAYIKAAEVAIQENPEQWLWSHRRWKFSRQD